MVRADLDSCNTIRHVQEGSCAAVAVTNYWEEASKSPKIQQGKDIEDAAKAVGVKRFVWPSCPSFVRVTDYAFRNIGHLESKYRGERYAGFIKDDIVPTSSILLA